MAQAIFNRLKKSASDLKLQHDYYFQCSDIKLLNSIFKINQMFDKKITMEDLEIRTKKQELLEYLIYDVIEQFQNGTSEITECIKNCFTIADLLSENRDTVLLNFCDKAENFNVILQSSELIYDRSSNSQNLCLIAVLILKYIGSSVNNFNQTALDMNETIMLQNTGLDANDFIRGLRHGENCY